MAWARNGHENDAAIRKQKPDHPNLAIGLFSRPVFWLFLGTVLKVLRVFLCAGWCFSLGFYSSQNMVDENV